MTRPAKIRLACAVGLVLSLAAAAVPQEPRADLERAERAYRVGDYERAAQLYRAALPTVDDRSGAVLFNLGNCALQLDRPAEAVWWYRRAELRLPDDADLRHNLQLAHARLGLGPVVGAPGDRSVQPWLWLAAALQSAGLLGLLVRRGRPADGLARWLPGALLSAGFGAAVWLAVVSWSPPARAVVAKGAVELRGVPEERAATVGTWRPGQLGRLVERRPDWVLVEIPGAATPGWAPQAAAGIVD